MSEGVCDAIKKNGYDVVALIGQGGFSECYKVYSQQYQQYFVCKAISVCGKNPEDKRRSFMNETEVLGKVIHPFIIKSYKTFTTDTHLFIILEYCPNGDMRTLIRRHGPLTETNQIYNYISKILNAFTYMESENMAHKDIKPSNILIDQNGNPKIADFGLASFYEENGLSDNYGGSLPFLPPEVLSKKPYNPMKADIWSFGVTLYYLVTGYYPFPLGNQQQLIKAISKGDYEIPRTVKGTIKNIIKGAIVVDPNERMLFSQMRMLISKEMEKQTTKSKPEIIRRMRSTGKMISSSRNSLRLIDVKSCSLTSNSFINL